MEIRCLVFLFVWSFGFCASLAVTEAQHASQKHTSKVMSYVLPSGSLSSRAASGTPVRQAQMRRELNWLNADAATSARDPPSIWRHYDNDGPLGVIAPTAGKRGTVLTMHVKAEAGQDCPAQTVPVTNLDQCDLAQKLLGGSNGIYPARHWEMWPHGCYRYTVDDTVFFNAFEGTTNDEAERYCQFSSFTSSDGDCGATSACRLSAQHNASSVDACGFLCHSDPMCAAFATPKKFENGGICWTFTGSSCTGDGGSNVEFPHADCYTSTLAAVEAQIPSLASSLHA